MPVKVVGTINGINFVNTIADGNNEIYHLSRNLIVVIGSETGVPKGLDFGILGQAIAGVNNIPLTQKEGTFVLDTDILKIIEPEEKQNFIEAQYNPTRRKGFLK